MMSWSLLLFALLLLLFLAAFHDVRMIWPNLIHDILVVLFLRDLLGWRQKLYNLLVLVTMSPISSCVTKLVPLV